MAPRLWFHGNRRVLKPVGGHCTSRVEPFNTPQSIYLNPYNYKLERSRRHPRMQFRQRPLKRFQSHSVIAKSVLFIRHFFSTNFTSLFLFVLTNNLQLFYFNYLVFKKRKPTIWQKGKIDMISIGNLLLHVKIWFLFVLHTKLIP